MITSQYGQVPVDVLKFLVNLLSILAKHKISNPVFELEHRLINEELERRKARDAIHFPLF